MLSRHILLGIIIIENVLLLNGMLSDNSIWATWEQCPPYIDESQNQTNRFPSRAIEEIEESTEGNDVLVVESPDGDHMLGLEGNDCVIGNDGMDTLEGGKGDDTLIGNGGQDQLLGGEGRDTFSCSRFDNDLTDADTRRGQDILNGVCDTSLVS